MKNKREPSSERKTLLRILEDAFVDADTSMKRFAQREAFNKAISEIMLIRYDRKDPESYKRFFILAKNILKVALTRSSMKSPKPRAAKAA